MVKNAMRNAQNGRSSMNRRATLRLAIGGILGIASPSVGAGSELLFASPAEISNLIKRQG
jgi:hypothetical protein